MNTFVMKSLGYNKMWEDDLELEEASGVYYIDLSTSTQYVAGLYIIYEPETELDISPEEQVALSTTALQGSQIPTKSLELVNGRCNICFEDVDNLKQYLLLNKCNHVFHQDCVLPWLLAQKTCPLCRGKI